jgi:hypothetical protein
MPVREDASAYGVAALQCAASHGFKLSQPAGVRRTPISGMSTQGALAKAR